MSDSSYPPDPRSPYGPPAGQPRRGMSNKAKFWLGVALAIPSLVLTAFLGSVPSIAVDLLGLSFASDLAGVATLVIDVLLFGLFIAAFVWERTRFLALGLLAGFAILLVLLAGACVALLAAYSGG